MTSLKDRLEEEAKLNKAHGEALEENSTRKENDRKEAELQEKRDKEEAFIKELRVKIKDVSDKRLSLEDLLLELKIAHEKAKTSVDTLKEEKDVLTKATEALEELLQNPDFSEILAKDEISSVDDMLGSDKYSGDEEVKNVLDSRKSYQEKRESVRELVKEKRKVKTKTQEILRGENESDIQRRTYDEVITLLETRIQEFAEEELKLYYRTPEGKKEMINRVGENHESRYDREKINKGDIQKIWTVNEKDIEFSETHGESETKEALSSYFAGILDDNLDKALNTSDEAKTEEVLVKKAREAGIPHLEEAITEIESLPQKWIEIRQTLKKLEIKRYDVEQKLINLCVENEDDRSGDQEKLFNGLKNYGRWGSARAKDIVEKYIDSISKLKIFSYGWQIIDKESIEKYLDDIISEEDENMKIIKGKDLKDLFLDSKNLDKNDIDLKAKTHSTNLRNPERIRKIVEEEFRYYSELEELLTNSKEVLDILNSRAHLGSDVERKELNIEDKEKLSFSGDVCVDLRDNLLSEVKENISDTKKEINEQAESWKEEITDKIDMDWASKERSLFQPSTGGQIRQIEDLVKKQEKASNLSLELDKVAARIPEQMNEPVSYSLGSDRKIDVYFKSLSQEDLDGFSDTMKQDEKNFEDSVLELREKTKVSESAGWMTRRKAAKAVDIAEENRDEAQEKYETSKKAWEDAQAKDRQLEPIRNWLHSAYEEFLSISQKSCTLKELIESLQKEIKVEIKPEQLQDYDKYQELKKREKEVSDAYNDKWKKKGKR